MADTLLGKAARAQRAIERLKQQELADRLGISRQTVRSIEQGRPGISNLVAEKYAEWLGNSLEQVIAAATTVVEEE